MSNKLLAEGLFSEELKKAVFSNYRHIGVITSKTGAALQDILSVFARRSIHKIDGLLPFSLFQ